MSDFRFWVEETSDFKNADKIDKNSGLEIRRGPSRGSGPTPVARGGSGAKAPGPPLAARLGPTLTPHHRRAIVASSAYCCFKVSFHEGSFFLKYRLHLCLG